jgi:hypothetical protein
MENPVIGYCCLCDYFCVRFLLMAVDFACTAVDPEFFFTGSESFELKDLLVLLVFLTFFLAGFLALACG